MQKSRKISAGIFSVLLLLLPVFALTKRQEIYDWWRLRDYEPPARVVQLAEATTMNDYGRKLFYVHHPQLDDKAAFNEHCQGGEESIILGCYISHRAIYLYDVQDERLKGVQEVTAAHEMLHAAYDRLGSDERNSVDAQLQNFFGTLQNERIKNTVASYRDKDPSTVGNELHSIIGTEIRQLPAELESYYKKYFTDRGRVVAYSEQYEQVFTERKNKVAQYDTQLADIKKRIDANEAELQAISETLSADRSRLDAYLSAGQTQEYNAAVPGFNAQVRRYNNLLDGTRNLIDRYNRIVAERNAVALEEQALVEAIDSRINRQPEE